MKSQWYGDNRDIAKWGVLLHLARIYHIKRILQVAYFRPSGWKHIEIDGQKYPIPESVINHFRNIRNIQNLPCQPEIAVLDLLFEDRDQYKQAVVDAIVAGQHPCIVFLDPDIGLEPPRSSPGLEHVLDSELNYIWNRMQNGDVLVFYQHKTNRKRQPWIEEKRKQFEQALRLPCGSAKVALSEIASDVAFYYCCQAIA